MSDFKTKLMPVESMNGIEPNYIPGMPLEYQFNAKEGQFYFDRSQELGEELTLIPIGIRVFQGELFAQAAKIWTEIYFVNGVGAVCALLFHNSSSRNFRKAMSMATLLYPETNVLAMRITMTPRPVTTKDGNNFHVLDFQFKELNEEDAPEFLIDNLHSNLTLIPNAEEISSTNWNPPGSYLPEG